MLFVWSKQKLNNHLCYYNTNKICSTMKCVFLLDYILILDYNFFIYIEFLVKLI